MFYMTDATIPDTYTVYDPSEDEVPEGIDVTVVGVHRDHGSVVVFEGLTNDGDSQEVLFGVDHRPAAELIAVLEAADCDLTVVVQPWQIVKVGQ